MTRERLDEAVRRLEEELQETPDLDPELRERLARVADEIDETLEENAGHEALGERIRELLLSLEASHPRLTALLDAVAQRLSSLGI